MAGGLVVVAAAASWLQIAPFASEPAFTKPVQPEASDPKRASTRAASSKAAHPATTVKPQRSAHPTAPEPAWLVEARAALAKDPERTLGLIRANRDPRVAVSPTVVELTLRALDARESQPKQHLPTQP